MIVQFPPTIVTADATSINTNGLISFAFNSTSNSNVTLTIDKPAGTKQGDVMFAFLNITIPNVTLNVPSGWINLQTTAIDNAGNNKDFGKYTYYKVAGASEPASYTWNFVNPTKAVGGIVSVTAAPGYSIFSTKADYPGSATNIIAPNVTTTVNSTLVIESFASASGKDLFTDPVSWARLWEAQTSGASGATESVVVKFFRNISSTGTVTETTTESVPRSVHIIAVPLRYEVVVTLRLTATASASQTAHVNNVFVAKTLNASASTSLNAQVINFFDPVSISATASTNNVQPLLYKAIEPGTAAFCDAATTCVSTVNNEDSPTALAYAQADASTVVNNIFQEVSISASATTDDINALVNNEDSSALYATATTSLGETVVNKITSLEPVLCSAVITDASAEVNNVAESSIVSTANSTSEAEVNNVFQPGATAACDSVVTINALVNGQGSANAIGLAEVNFAALVNNEADLAATSSASVDPIETETFKVVQPGTLALGLATSVSTAIVNNEAESTAVALAELAMFTHVNNVADSAVVSTASATLEALVDNPDSSSIIGSAQTTAEALVNNTFQPYEVTGTAEAEMLGVTLIRTVSPNPLLGICETSTLNGSTRLPSQYGLGVDVEPINANLNVNIIRIL